MVPFSRRSGPAVILLALLTALPACKKKEEPREPEPGATAEEQTRLYITTQDVKVRSGPGTRHKIIAEIKAQTNVHVAGKEAGWLRVVSTQGRPPGYIDQRFAKPLDPSTVSTRPVKGIYITTAEVSVREKPGLDYKAVARIEKGTRVTVVGAEGAWLKVESRHGNPPGYIEARFAKRETD